MKSKHKQKISKEELENFDKEENIIIPETIFGELVYILYIIRDIVINRKDIKRDLFLHKRQINFFNLWRKTQKGYSFYENYCNINRK